MNKKNILLIGGYAPSLINFRGALLHSLVAQGHIVMACAPNADSAVIEQLRFIGVQYYPIRMARAEISPSKDLRTMVELIFLLRRLQPDIVLSYTIKPVLYGGITSRIMGIRNYYAMITGVGYAFSGTSFKQRLIGLFAAFLYRSALKSAQSVFFQNPDDRDLFIQRKLVNIDKTIIINGSGVDIKFFSLQPLPEKPVFLLIARLLVEKGIREYVAAAKVVRSKYPESQFKLVGGVDPNPSSISQAEISAWVKEGTIEYLGELKDVRPALTECRFYVLPSYYREGTPRSVLEAMSMGRPIITTDAPGCRETVQEGVNGLLIPIKNSNALAEAMISLLENPELAKQMSKESRRIAEQKYDVHKVNATILKSMGLQDASV